MEDVLDRYSCPINWFSQRGLLARVLSWRRSRSSASEPTLPAPAVAVLDAGPDDGTPMFQSPGDRWTALVACNYALPGNEPIRARCDGCDPAVVGKPMSGRRTFTAATLQRLPGVPTCSGCAWHRFD